jgi:bacillithiol biosynthesis deacetylase BshB1
MKLDVLAFAAHPDDVELSCSGTMLLQHNLGRKTGIIDLTQGELGTRGSAEIRAAESKMASGILGLSVRENLKLRDGFFVKDEPSLLKIIEQIRLYQPEIVLANAQIDRHTDHGRAADLVHEACFLSGLRKITTLYNGAEQQSWRPKAIYHYIQDYAAKPDVIVDITPFFEKKMKSIYAYSSQFYNPNSEEPATPISGSDFLEFIKARNMEFGRLIGCRYGEGFTVKRPMGVTDLFQLI